MEEERREHPSSEGPRPLGSLVESLASVADEFDAGLGELTAGQREDVVVALADAMGRVEALLCDAVGVADARGDHLASGARSLGAFVAARTELSSGHVRSSALMARQLEQLPAVAAAWRSGRLGTAKIRSILRTPEALWRFLIRDQDELVRALTPLTVAGAGRHLGRWEESVTAELDASPDDPEPAPEQPVNSVRMSAGVGSEQMLHGIFDSITGAEVAAMIQAEIDRAHAAGEFDRSDGRSLLERQGDALLGLLRRGATAPVSGSGPGRPRVVVNIQVDLARILGIGATTVADALAWPCETEDGTIVPLSRVLDALDDSTINLILGVLGRDGVRFRPVGEISTKRLADASQRRLLRARDRTCRWPGCDARATWARAHHEPPFELTHHTTVTQLVLLCPHHHRLRHHHGYRMQLEPDGDLTIRGPDGRLVDPAEPDRKLRRAPAIADRPPWWSDQDEPPGPERLAAIEEARRRHRKRLRERERERERQLERLRRRRARDPDPNRTASEFEWRRLPWPRAG